MLSEAAERALQDGDEGGFEFQNMLASEITEAWHIACRGHGLTDSIFSIAFNCTWIWPCWCSKLHKEKIEEIENKYGSQPPLPGAKNEPEALFIHAPFVSGAPDVIAPGCTGANVFIMD